MGGASAPPGGSNMPQADATPHFGEREVAPLMRHQKRRALPLGNGIAPP
nr:MAG TPA: hypothetical protein [Caudoviricetes sp.]